MITAFRLSKSFGPRRVLDELDVAVNPGGVTLLVGANAAGKTTLLRVLCGLTEPDEGTVAVAGIDVRRKRREALEQLAFLPQAPRFHPRLAVRQVADYYGRLRACAPSDIDAALAAWGLSSEARTPTGRLSGGLRQRLALAVFTLADAPVLLLDEPGLSLDPEWRGRLQEFLAAAARRDRTILVATHLLGEWEGRIDRCLVIERGKMAGELAPDRLRDSFGRRGRATFEASGAHPGGRQP